MGGVHRQSAQYSSNFERTVRSGENTTESRSAIANKFHTDMENRKQYQYKSRRRRPISTPTSVSSPVYTISSVKESEGNMIGSAHASKTYGM